MKNWVFLLPALALAVFGGLLALDIVNFEEGLAAETSRIDFWVMVSCFAGAAGLIGLTIADSNHAEEDVAASSRAAAATRLSEGRPDPSELPAKPGSLLKQSTTPSVKLPTRVSLDIEPADDAVAGDAVPDTAEPFADEIEPVESAELEVAEPLPSPTIDPVDAELQSLIDDDQMQEINELVAAAETDADLDDAAAGEIVPGAETVEPLARLELRLADYDDEDLKRVVKESESVVIAEMVRSGQLSSEGELTQQDIASMVFLAYTSEEMLAELRLRKSIDSESNAQPGLDASTGSDFAPLKNIE